MYWYIALSTKYPKNRRVVIKLVRERYIIIALTVEADVSAIKACSLVYLGYGAINDLSIQSALTQAIKRIKG